MLGRMIAVNNGMLFIFFFSQWTFFPELFKSTFAENIKCKKCKRAEQAAQHISVMSEAALTSQKFLGFLWVK